MNTMGFEYFSLIIAICLGFGGIIKFLFSINERTTKIETKITDLEVKMTKEISNLELKVTNEISNVKTEISNLEVKVTNEISDLKIETKVGFEKLNSKFDRLEEKNIATNQRVDKLEFEFRDVTKELINKMVFDINGCCETVAKEIETEEEVTV